MRRPVAAGPHFKLILACQRIVALVPRARPRQTALAIIALQGSSKSSRIKKSHFGRRQPGRSQPPHPELCLAEESYANMLGPISPLTSMITSAGTWFLPAAARMASVLGAS